MSTLRVIGRHASLTCRRAARQIPGETLLAPFANHANLHTSTSRDATPLPHPTVPGPPPDAPQAATTTSQDRVARKRRQADLLRQGQQARADSAKPGSILQKRFWKNVSVQESEDGLQVMLDARPVRTAAKQILILPHDRKALATSVAVEWDQLVTAQQALKQHYIPLTSLTARAIDIEVADQNGDDSIRSSIITMLMRYLATDTLLCWAPEKNIHDPEGNSNGNLRQKQREAAEPIIAYLQAHIFPGVKIEPVLDNDSIMPRSQSQLTQQVIRGWIAGLSAYDIAALERGVLATKSLLIATRLLVEWSRDFSHVREHHAQDGPRFGIEQSADAATLETRHQVAQWGEVEDTHDVEKEDLRRQLGSVVLLVS